MSKGFIVIDGNAIAHAATAQKQKLHVGEVQVQGIYHFMRMLRPLVARFPQLTPVILWDGRSWRYDKYPEYKASRNKPPVTPNEIKIAEIRQQVKLQRPYIQKALRLLGVRQITTLNLEADDLAGGIVRKYGSAKTILLVTADEDWLQLVGPRVSWYNPIADKMVTAAKFEAATGVKTGRAFLECKALQGDTSDDIPGVGGIGQKGAAELVNTYGSVTDFINRTIDGTLVGLPKKFQDFADKDEKQELYRRNYRLMDLISESSPTPINLKISQSSLDIAGFEQFCRVLCFKSLLTDLAKWCEPFNRSKS